MSPGPIDRARWQAVELASEQAASRAALDAAPGPDEAACAAADRVAELHESIVQ